MRSEEGFVARWSRRKAAERNREATDGGPVDQSVAEPAQAASPPAGPTDAADDPDAVLELPPLDSLTKDSDFAPFLRRGVPEEMKHAALRKLWTSDPVWALPERLDIHNLDYTFPAVPELVETAYRVGQGFLDAVPPTTGTAAAAADGEKPPEPNDQVITRSDDTVIDQPPPVGCNEGEESAV